MPQLVSYCMYLRKSRADFEAEQRGEGETLARHRAVLTGLAARNHHAIGHIYQEIVSGETLSDRPQAQALLADVAAGKWRGVYVMEVERLARGDTMDQGLVAHAFKAAGTFIITPSKTYNPADPSDEDYFEFSLFMSRREYKTINRRMQGGRVQSTREGKFIASRAPYGYRKYKLPNEKGYSLTIHDEEAAIVRQIFDWYLHDGSGISRIASRLMQLHAPVGEHGTAWTACRVYRLLTNPVYIGLIQWGKDKTVRTVTAAGIQKHRVLQARGELSRGLHPAIITEDTFNAVQDMLHTPRAHLPVRKGAQLSNPLSGLVVCSQCGHALTGLPACGRQPAILKCRTHGCPTVQNYRLPIERAILDTLRSWLSDGGAVTVPPDRISPDRQLTLRASLSAMGKEREKLLKQLNKLQDLVEQEVYTVVQYNDRYATLQSRLDRLDADISLLSSELDSRADYLTPQELRPALIRLLAEYDTATPAQQNVMLKTCISKVIYHKQKRGNTIGGVTYSDANQFTLDVFPVLRKT